MDYIVYTETINKGIYGIERWYYGTYDRSTANKVAIELGNEFPTFHCVCRADKAEELNIQNLPL